MLTIFSDSQDAPLFCLPLFFVKVTVISAFGRPLFGLLDRRGSYSGLSCRAQLLDLWDSQIAPKISL
jgi:hypothetical protein